MILPFFLQRLVRFRGATSKQERALEYILRYRFRDPTILRKALTHRSTLPESGAKPEDANERLELLGDAVLDLIVVEGLWRRFPTFQEGDLSKLKSMLVSGTALSSVALSFHLGKYVVMSEGEERNGGRTKASILEDTFEALVAALYLDGGLPAAKRFVDRLILVRADHLARGRVDINYKSQLLEYAQARGIPAPFYRVIAEHGPDHQKEFEVIVHLEQDPIGYGTGPNKKGAQQAAARDAIQRLESEPWMMESAEPSLPSA